MDKMKSSDLKILKKYNWLYYLVEINSKEYLWERFTFLDIVLWFPMFGKTTSRIFLVDKDTNCSIPSNQENIKIFRNYSTIEFIGSIIFIFYIFLINGVGPIIQLPEVIKNNWLLIFLLGYLIYLLYFSSCYRKYKHDFNEEYGKLLIFHPLNKKGKIILYPWINRLILWGLFAIVLFGGFYIFGIYFSDLGLFIYMIMFNCMGIISAYSMSDNRNMIGFHDFYFEVKEVE